MASETDDAAEAAARLEIALERIAALAGPRRLSATPTPEGSVADDHAVSIDEITARLDALIDRLRAVLGNDQD